MYKTQCRWFTSLISNHRILESLERLLKDMNASDIQIIDMQHAKKPEGIGLVFLNQDRSPVNFFIFSRLDYRTVSPFGNRHCWQSTDHLSRHPHVP